jgi:biotin-(acetyl-CoA carboxylase) ligase
VGINVNNRLARGHSDIGNGAALCEAAGRECNIARVLTHFLNAFQARMNQLARSDSQLPRTWQALTWLKDQMVEVQLADGRRFKGVCAGTDIDGALLVDRESGRERFCSGSLRPC